MTDRLIATFRSVLRWWRSRSLAAQLVLTNLVVVAVWAGTTRQIISLQDSRREYAEQTAVRAGAAVLVVARLEPTLANLATDQRGLALTGDSAFSGPYRLGRIQLDLAIDSLRALAIDNEELSAATARVDRVTRAWARAASRQMAARSTSIPTTASWAAA